MLDVTQDRLTDLLLEVCSEHTIVLRSVSLVAHVISTWLLSLKFAFRFVFQRNKDLLINAIAQQVDSKRACGIYECR